MPAYNTVTAELTCMQCDQAADRRVQFRYADTWQYEYALGDELRWGGNDVGVRGAARVRVGGFTEPCPVCGAEGIEVAIYVECDVLTSVVTAPRLPPPWTGGQRFEVEEA